MPRTTLIVALALAITVFSGRPADAQAAVAADSAAVDSAVTTPVVQRDLMDVLKEHILHKRVEPQATFERGLNWAVLPSFSYNEVYGLALGLSISGAGQRSVLTERYSNLSFSGNYSTTGQLQLQTRGDLFTTGGNYLVRADVRYLDTTRSTWGLGPYEADQQEYPMSFALTRFYTTVLRRVAGPVFIGIGYHLDEFDDIVDERARAGEETPFTVYSGGSPSKTKASGFSINLLGDTRDNIVNATSGYYLSWNFRNFMPAWGSDDRWQEMWAEMRVYPHLPARSRNVLAFWLYAWMTFGEAPYLNLPSNGWDTYGRAARGYLQGRMRGTDQVYLEAEYRFPLTSDGLFGGVVFASITSTTEMLTGAFGPNDIAGGLGLRIKFNKAAGTNLIIDHGWGQDGSSNIFLGMTETF